MRKMAINTLGDILMGSMIPVFVCSIHRMAIGAGSRRAGHVAGHIGYVNKYAYNNGEGNQGNDYGWRFENSFQNFPSGIFCRYNPILVIIIRLEMD